tara:strand:+ start:3871 stop:5022 length:1152 start_codon:yes stop_codon:yes gene_type:complete
MKKVFDIFIIGGGINGVGIARDAAGRGFSVCLADKGKIGSATSSWSSKLIHGGLRYLENYDFKLVRESLKEREIIHFIASSITRPIPFLIPHTKNIRSKWLLKLGLFIYDSLGGKSSIPKSTTVDLNKNFKNILKEKYFLGFKYYDIQVDDKKLAQLNAEDAKRRGALIFENMKIINVNRNKDCWNIFFENNTIVKAKILINATGPWVNQVLKNILNINSKKSIRLVKGSHIITKKLYDEELAFTFQNEDKRIIFVIPYKDHYSLIGTTEVEVDTPENPRITKEEIEYLINSLNNYFIKPINENDIVETYSGIRPLIEDYKDASRVTRDYVFDLNKQDNLALLLNIYGGKLTTYRKLSEKVMSEIEPYLTTKKTKPWTHRNKL